MKFFMALLASASLAAASVQPWVVHNFTAEARVGTSERKNTYVDELACPASPH